ncbi:MAG TPA: response regulator [Terriglobales bacterium]|nr:response regulator [Terriglobales bacterium]
MARDIYKYFRVEARELLEELTRIALEAEKGTVAPALMTRLLRAAHTLKGAAQVVHQGEIAEAAHAIEGVFSPYRESGGPVSKEQAREAVRLLDGIGARLEELGSPPAQHARPAGPCNSASEVPDSVRVDVEEVEALLASLTEVGTEMRKIRPAAALSNRARELAMSLAHEASPTAHAFVSRTHALGEEVAEACTRLEREVTSALEKTERELAQAQARANRLRLLPVSTIVPALARTARDAAQAVGKAVDFRASGEELRLDADVLAVVQHGLLQLVRNAVAHGIESPEARTRAGKAPRGVVELRAERKAGRMVFACRDDGGGIDLAAIRSVAVRKGVVTAGEAESVNVTQAVDLLLKGGFSTSGQVTGIAGRGIGLDILRDAAVRLKGEVSVVTKAGQGTTFEIAVPVSRSSIEVLLVESAGQRACLPLDSVCRALAVREQEISPAGSSESIAYEGQTIQFVTLTAALGAAGPGDHRERKTAVVVRSGAELVAVGIERLLGTETVLMRRLPAIAAAAEEVAGAYLDAEGNPILVLEPAHLANVAGRRSARETAAAERQAPILIVDDSLTTRMVEQNILESAGHRVDTATSGEEALAKARDCHYALFVVDIEMPGMDGFQLLSRFREDPELREVPSVLVSSRRSADDKRRGAEAGARAYIVKSEFEQTRFLDLVGQLVG